MVKDFTEWHGVKTRIDDRQNAPTFQQREIWWCSVGVNVGDEIDGKGPYATRPVLVVRKFNKRIFFGVPLTTQIKQNPYYHRIHFLGLQQCVMLSQLRLWEGRRMRSKMGQLPEDQFNEVREALKGLI